MQGAGLLSCDRSLLTIASIFTEFALRHCSDHFYGYRKKKGGYILTDIREIGVV